MTKLDKLIKKILEGSKNITIADAETILNHLGYTAISTKGSHRTYRKADSTPITLVLTQKQLKPYLVNKLQVILKQEGY